jgi:hypothetical protein
MLRFESGSMFVREIVQGFLKKRHVLVAMRLLVGLPIITYLDLASTPQTL